MKSSQVRLWLSLAGSLAIIGCTQSPNTKSSLGHLPGQDPLASDQPRVNSATYCAHGNLLERQGQFERAIVQYRRALALTPDFLTARNRLGITLNKIGRHADASAEFRQALAQHPEQAYLHNNLGFSLYLEEDYDGAIASINTALELDPGFARAHMNYALVLAKLEKFDQAFEELSQAGSTIDAYFNMGVILTEAKQYAEASQYLEAALAANPNFDAARQQLLLVSRLAAEHEAQQAVNEALAAETSTDQTPPTSANETTNVEIATADTTPPVTPEQYENTESVNVATGPTPAQQVGIVDIETTAPEPTPVETPEPQAKAIAATPEPQPALEIEDVPLSKMRYETNAQSEKPYSQATVDADPIETTEQPYQETPTAVTADLLEQEVLTVAPTTATPPVATTSGTVIVEDVPINQSTANVRTNQRASLSNTPAPTEPEQYVANETYSKQTTTANTNSAVVVETIALTPAAGNVQSAPPSNTSSLDVTDDAFGSNSFNSRPSTSQIDEEKLMLLISEALHALQYNPAEFDALWRQVSYCLNPETAPDTQKAIGK